MPAIPLILPSVLKARVKPEYFQAIPLIVEAEPDVGVNFLSGAISEKLKTRIGKTIPSMNMFAILLPRNMLDDLAAINGVKSISLDRTHFAIEIPAPDIRGGIMATMDGIIPTSEAIKRVNVPALHSRNITGRGVNVAVLDTGIDLTNPQIRGEAAKMSTIKAQPTGDDENGHGSHCATTLGGKPFRDSITGLLATGVAPDCNLTAIKVLGFGIGTGMTSDIMEAMELSVAQGNKIISMSLGSEGSEDEDLDPMVRMINQYAETHPDVIFVIAAGNSGPGGRTVGIPGCAENAITVGSWGIIDNDIAYFSSRGPTIQSGKIKPDICGCGGGRHIEGTRPEENIWSGTAFGSLLDPIVDKVENGFTAIKGTCLRGSSLVYTNPKGPVHIDRIQPGDTVFSLGKDGKIIKQKVNALMCNGIKDIFRLSAGGRTIECTDNHPFLTVKYQPTDYLIPTIIGSEYIKQKRREMNMTIKELAKLISVPATTYQSFENRYNGMPDHTAMAALHILGINVDAVVQKSDKRLHSYLQWKQMRDINIGDEIITLKKLPESEYHATTEYSGITITRDMARLFGFLIGDGWLCHNRSRKHQNYQIAFAEHRNGQKDGMNDVYRRLFEKVFKKPVKLEKRGRWFYCFSKNIWNTLKILGLDAYAPERSIPEWIYKMPKDHQESFIEGYIDSDGYRHTSMKGLVFEASSESLIHGLHELLIMNGYRVGRIIHRTRTLQPPGSPAPIRAHSWKFTTGTTKTKKGSGRNCTLPIDENIFATAKVTHIEPCGKDMVYDIEVDGSHNFISEGMVVHNSMATPQVAGILALWKQMFPELTTQVAKGIFAAMSGKPKDNLTGWGIIDATWILSASEGGGSPAARTTQPAQQQSRIARTATF